jgi:hypothetical protein
MQAPTANKTQVATYSDPEVVQHGVAGDGLVLFGAENQPYGRIIILGYKNVIEHSNVAIHLPHVLVGKFANLQVD